MRVGEIEPPVPMDIDEVEDTEGRSQGFEIVPSSASQARNSNYQLANEVSAFIAERSQNWPTKVDALWREAPNLAHLVGVMAYWLAGETNEFIALNGGMVQVCNENRSTQNPMYIDFAQEQDSSGFANSSIKTEDIVAKSIRSLFRDCLHDLVAANSTSQRGLGFSDIGREQAQALVQQYLQLVLPPISEQTINAAVIKRGAVDQAVRAHVLRESTLIL